MSHENNSAEDKAAPKGAAYWAGFAGALAVCIMTLVWSAIYIFNEAPAPLPYIMGGYVIGCALSIRPAPILIGMPMIATGVLVYQTFGGAP